MSRRDNGEARCRRCHVHANLCVCSFIPEPRLETRTRLVVFIHFKEDRKPTNSGRLATECLTNTEVIVRGHEDSPTPPFVAPEGTRPLLLFPSEDAVPLTEFASSTSPITLIVPDGTWRQASKVRMRVPGLRNVQCVTLPKDTQAPTTYRLRAETREKGLATMEAIARAFGILEGPEVEQAMERVFRAMVERTLWSRGEIAKSDVTCGIPEGAMQHDPRSGLD